MSGPPEDVPANELFLKLMERPRPSEEVPFPALDTKTKKGRIRIQVLSKEQHDRARLSAQQALKKSAAKYGIPSLSAQDMQSEAVRGVESDLAACEVLAMACLQPKPINGGDEDDERARRPFVFADGEAVGKTLTADEVAYLFAAYTLVQHKYGPHEAICLPEDANAWVRRLKEGAADFPFLLISSPQRAELLEVMADRLYRLSELLESRWTEFPESLRSDLQTYCLGTASSTEPAESTSAPALPGPGTEVSFQDAMRLANLLKKPATEE